MKRTAFITPTVFDLNSIKVFGMNAKPNSETPIGRFGTGLKIAIAVLLREGAKIDLYCNGDHYEFYTKAVDFRGEIFDQIWYKRTNGILALFDNHALDYTTHLGHHWVLWQAFRELYANTLDENGYTELCDIDVDWAAKQSRGETIIVVKHVEFARLFETRDEIFLPQERRIISEVVGKGNISPKKSGHIYFRGMRAFDLPKEKPAMFTYNVQQDVELTEDRNIKNQFEAKDIIQDLIVQSDDATLIKAVLSAPDHSFEKELNFEYVYSASETFKEVVRKERNAPGFNRSAGVYYERALAPATARKLLTDTEWSKLLSALSRAHDKAMGIDGIPNLEQVYEMYRRECEKEFNR